MTMTAKREQNRRFGEYHGEDGLEGQGPQQSIWENNPCKSLILFLPFYCNSQRTANRVPRVTCDPLHGSFRALPLPQSALLKLSTELLPETVAH